MDKETLSNYGWIVILVLVLAVMLALATPFGTFIAGAIKSTTAGLFDVNQAALGSAGINVDDLVFENCDHLETELRNVTDTYTGDTCCKACGAVMSAGQTVRAKVPEGGYYYVGVTGTSVGSTSGYTAKYGPGEEMPEAVNDGDVYVYGDYEYRYNQVFTHPYAQGAKWSADTTLNGWSVRVRSTSKSSYGEILSSINGKPVNTLSYTFYECTAITDLSNFTIPDSVTSMPNTFRDCTSLKYAPKLPKNLTSMYQTFVYCSALTNEGMPTIPNTVTDMHSAFANCKTLTDVSDLVIPNSVVSLDSTFGNCTALTNEGLPTIPNNVTSMQSTFYGCTALTDVSGFVIPSSVTNASFVFYGCTSLTTATIIPSNVTNMSYAFQNCTSLTGTITINANIGSYGSCFAGVDFEAQNLTLDGSCTMLDTLGATGKNYCADCNGKCNGGH